MARIRIPLLLCLSFLLMSCNLSVGKTLETGKDLIDIYQYTAPLHTPIVEAFRPTPTFGISDPILDYFAFASSPGCGAISLPLDVSGPFQSIACNLRDVGVRYDYWFLPTTMDEFHSLILEEAEVTRNTTWNDEENPDAALGKLYEFIDQEGKANIIWTVNGKNLSGWARRADNDQEALLTWWSNTGGNRK